jgi:hypothetical protein
VSSSPTLPRWPVHIVTVVWRGCARPVGSAPAEALIPKAATSRSRSEKNSPWAGPRVSRFAASRCGWGEVPRRSPAISPATVPHAVGIEPRRRTPAPASAGGARVLDEPTRRDRYLNSAKTERRPTFGGQRCVSELRYISGRRIVYLTGPRWARACRHTHKKYESTYGNPAPESGEPGVMTTLGMTLDPLSRFAARCRPPSFSDPITRRPALGGFV